MADSNPVVDFDTDKDVLLVKDALRYIRTREYPAGRYSVICCCQLRNSNGRVCAGVWNNGKRVIRRKAEKLAITEEGEVVYCKKDGKKV